MRKKLSEVCEFYSRMVVIGRKGNLDNLIFVKESFWNVDTVLGLITNKTLLIPKYLFRFCLNFDSERINAITSLTKKDFLHELYHLDLVVQFQGVEQIAKVVAE